MKYFILFLIIFIQNLLFRSPNLILKIFFYQFHILFSSSGVIKQQTYILTLAFIILAKRYNFELLLYFP